MRGPTRGDRRGQRQRDRRQLGPASCVITIPTRHDALLPSITTSPVLPDQHKRQREAAAGPWPRRRTDIIIHLLQVPLTVPQHIRVARNHHYECLLKYIESQQIVWPLLRGLQGGRMHSTESKPQLLSPRKTGPQPPRLCHRVHIHELCWPLGWVDPIALLVTRQRRVQPEAAYGGWVSWGVGAAIKVAQLAQMAGTSAGRRRRLAGQAAQHS
jgi:hypothetical protein